MRDEKAIRKDVEAFNSEIKRIRSGFDDYPDIEVIKTFVRENNMALMKLREGESLYCIDGHNLLEAELRKNFREIVPMATHLLSETNELSCRGRIHKLFCELASESKDPLLRESGLAMAQHVIVSTPTGSPYNEHARALSTWLVNGCISEPPKMDDMAVAVAEYQTLVERGTVSPITGKEYRALVP